MGSFNATLKKGYWLLAALGALYVFFIALLCVPFIQQHSLYAHKIVNAFWIDLDKPPRYGFALGQVSPFNLTTPDDHSLYCWHILPLPLYLRHASTIQKSLSKSPSHHAALARSLLTSDPSARLILNYHGNAGNIAQGERTNLYHTLTSTSPHTHILTCDYRGFGRSTGSPNEAGLITDAIALASLALDDLRIPPNRILLCGQSLGTAVATATALYFAAPDDNASLLPADIQVPTARRTQLTKAAATHFASLTLIAPFANLPSLLQSYRIKGLLPILSPLRPYPSLQRFVSRYLIDHWPTDERIAALLQAVTQTQQGVSAGHAKTRVQILHAVDDAEIPYRQSLALFKRAASALGAEGEREGVRALERVAEGQRGQVGWLKGKLGLEVELHVERFGGHNRLVTFAPVWLAVSRALGLDKD